MPAPQTTKQDTTSPTPPTEKGPEKASEKTLAEQEQLTQQLIANARESRVQEAKRAEAAAREEARPTAEILAALRKIEGDAELGDAGSALFLAHMLAELGTAKVHKMTGAEAAAYAETWRRAHPGAWPQVRMGDTQGFERMCRMYGIQCDTAQGYQAMMGKVAPVARQAGF
jgi:hypothetical protein